MLWGPTKHGVDKELGGTMHNAQRQLFHMVLVVHDDMMIIHDTDYAEDLVSVGVVWSLKRNMKPPHRICAALLVSLFRRITAK